MKLNLKQTRLLLTTALGAVLAISSPALGMSLRDATQIALESNPEINQAVANREAIEFELRQALGLYAPRVDLEASAGVERLDNPSRRSAGIQNNALFPAQVAISSTFALFDSGYRQSEANRQAARVDGASYRVLERSEFISLQIARTYFQVMLQLRAVELSRQNVDFHQSMLNDVSEAIDAGQLTEADRFQAVERLAASRARLTEAGVELEVARIEFNKWVGLPLQNASMPQAVGADLPASLDIALGAARINNPQVLLATADIDAAASLVDQAESELGPTLDFETRAAAGWDVNGADGYTTDLSARLTFRVNLYDGGIASAQVQEQVRRESEAIYARDEAYREVEEAVRTSWVRLQSQRELTGIYQSQLNASADLVTSYNEQFKIGDRSLLDVLDAQNTRYNLSILKDTAAYSVRFAEYRLMASCGLLLEFMGLRPSAASEPYARELLESPSWEESEPRVPRMELDLDSPIDLTQLVN